MERREDTAQRTITDGHEAPRDLIEKSYVWFLCTAFGDMSGSAFEDRRPTGSAWSLDGWKYFGEGADILVRNCGVIQLAVEQEVHLVWGLVACHCVRCRTLQWGGRSSGDKLNSALDDFFKNCKGLWETRTGLHRDTCEVYWEEVLETDYNCDLEGDETQVTVVRLEEAGQDMPDMRLFTMPWLFACGVTNSAWSSVGGLVRAVFHWRFCGCAAINRRR
jgi:hypothetical protein